MPDPDPFQSFVISLASRLPTSRVSWRPLFVLLGILAAIALAPLLVLVAWDLIAPVLHAPFLTYGEAAGFVFFYGILVATIAFLKE